MSERNAGILWAFTSFLQHVAYVCDMQKPGYSTEMRPESIEAYEYPVGFVWQALFDQGLFKRLNQKWQWHYGTDNRSTPGVLKMRH